MRSKTNMGMKYYESWIESQRGIEESMLQNDLIAFLSIGVPYGKKIEVLSHNEKVLAGSKPNGEYMLQFKHDKLAIVGEQE